MTLQWFTITATEGAQYRPIRDRERLAESGGGPSVDSVADGCDNALAARINGVFKVELIHRAG